MDAIEKFLKDRDALVAVFVSEEYETNEQRAEAILSAGWTAPGEGADITRVNSIDIDVSQGTWDTVTGHEQDGEDG